MTRRVFLVAGAGAFARRRDPIRLGSLDERAILRRVAPEYPELARRCRISGTVRLTILVGADGTVRWAKLVSGHPLLVPAALKAVASWLFKPILLNGSPVEFYTPVEIGFAMSPSAELKDAGTSVAPNRNMC